MVDTIFLTALPPMKAIDLGDGTYAVAAKIMGGPITAPTGRTVNFTVAASDASTSVKSQADIICDGVADQTDIQSLVDVLGAIGGSVWLSAGTYYFSAPVIMTSLNNVTIYAHYNAHIITDGGVNAFNIITCTDINLEGLEISSADGSINPGANGLIYIKGGSNISVRNNKIHDFFFGAWVICDFTNHVKASNINVSNNEFYNIYYSAIAFSSGIDVCKFNDNYLHDSVGVGSSNVMYGISCTSLGYAETTPGLAYPSNIEVKRNIIHNIETTPTGTITDGTGTLVGGSPQNLVPGLNTFENTGGAGTTFTVNLGASSHGWAVSGTGAVTGDPASLTTGNTTITVGTGTFHVTIRGRGKGIDLHSGTELDVSENQITNVGEYGIFLHTNDPLNLGGTALGLPVTSNWVISNNIIKNAYCPIAATNEARDLILDNVNILNNTIYQYMTNPIGVGCGNLVGSILKNVNIKNNNASYITSNRGNTFGIAITRSTAYAAGCDNFNVTNNSIDGYNPLVNYTTGVGRNGGTGVYVAYLNKVNVSDNYLTYYTNGVNLRYSTDNAVVSRNKIKGNIGLLVVVAGRGISLYDGDDITVSDNVIETCAVAFDLYAVDVVRPIFTGNSWYGCTYDNLTNLAVSPTIRRNTKSGFSYLGSGEIATYSFLISTLTQDAFNSVDNPFGRSVILLSEDYYVSVGATATTPNIDCGLGSSATTDYTNLTNDLPGETIGCYKSTIATPGTQTVPLIWTSGAGNRYLNHSIKDAAATGMVMRCTVTIMGI